jgi:UDP-glucose 4-epimerase
MERGMMNVAVTGGCGFIGSHLVRRLLAKGCRVSVLDDFSTGNPAALEAHPHLVVHRGCVTDAEAMGRALKGAERIFHFAAVVGQVNVCRVPGWTVRVSTESVRHINLLAPNSFLILASSSAVYGMTGEAVCREDAPVTREMVLDYDGGAEGYAYGKWQAERLATTRASGTALVVRPFNVIGPGQVGTYGMVVPRLVRSTLRGEPATIYGTGAQTRSFGDVHAFVDHLLALASAWRACSRPHLVYNIGNTLETSIDQLADSIGRVLGTTTPRRYIPYHRVYPGKRDVLRRRPSLDRTESLLGPLAWPPLEATIAEIAAVTSLESRALLRHAQLSIAS